MSFKQYLNEMAGLRKPDPVELKQITSKDLVPLLGKGRINSIMKNPLWKDISHYEHAYKYEVDKWGFVFLEVYAFMRSVHTMPDGKIRPQFMVRFRFSYSGHAVTGATKYYRPKEPNEMEQRYGPSAGWVHSADWEKK